MGNWGVSRKITGQGPDVDKVVENVLLKWPTFALNIA
jgi:hypothetical protein